jgi:hypothetical protein
MVAALALTVMGLDAVPLVFDHVSMGGPSREVVPSQAAP